MEYGLILNILQNLIVSKINNTNDYKFYYIIYVKWPGLANLYRNYIEIIQ